MQQLAALTAQHDDDLQAFQQTQLASLRRHLHAHLPIDMDDQSNDQSIDDLAQDIADRIARERDQLTSKYHSLEQECDQLRTGNTPPRGR